MNIANPIKAELDLVGGEIFLKSVLETFYDKLFNDIFVSFLFVNTDKNHIIKTQYSFLRKAFGYTKEYSGKLPGVAHTHLPILPGHFNRRIEILRESLIEHEAPESLITKWIKLESTFRKIILKNSKHNLGKNQ